MSAATVPELLVRCGMEDVRDVQGRPGDGLQVHSPIDGAWLASLRETTDGELQRLVEASARAFLAWRDRPAPARGALVRLWAQSLRESQEDIAQLITLEVGKTPSEARGEVQEAIDICEFALGLSRQLQGHTIVSERPGHRLMEQYHPLGPVAVVTAFNFPCAVFAWNAAIALVCGDPVLFKPSPKAPLTGLATLHTLRRAASRLGADAPQGLAQIALGGRALALALAGHPSVALVSATGSTAMGRELGQRVAARFGRRILELGGNNAMVLTPAADLAQAVRAILFSAAGTAGQRCTTLRRLIVHRDMREPLLCRLLPPWRSLRVDDPRTEGTLVGPLIDRAAFEAVQAALAQARAEGGQLLAGGERLHAGRWPDAFYMHPALVAMPAQTDLVRRETFGPLLYLLEYQRLEDAIALNNDVPQGLSSCIFSNDLREVERFLGAAGSDCGLANANAGPSGAEIGGAFGGEKASGGDRESGSDAWRQYMRRSTQTVNYSGALPLAQGVRFD